MIFSSEYVNIHGIDTEKLNEYSVGVDEKSKKIQELLAGIKDLVTVYKAYKLKSDSKRSGSPLINPVVKESLFKSIKVQRVKFDELEKIFAEQISQMQEYFASDFIKQRFYDKLKNAEKYSEKSAILFSTPNIIEMKDMKASPEMKSKWNELGEFLMQGLREYYLNAAIEVRENFSTKDKDEEENTKRDVKQVIDFLEGYQAADRLFDRQLNTVVEAWGAIKNLLHP